TIPRLTDRTTLPLLTDPPRTLAETFHNSLDMNRQAFRVPRLVTSHACAGSDCEQRLIMRCTLCPANSAPRSVTKSSAKREQDRVSALLAGLYGYAVPC